MKYFEEEKMILVRCRNCQNVKALGITIEGDEYLEGQMPGPCICEMWPQ